MEEKLGVNQEAKKEAIFDAIPEVKQEARLGEKLEATIGADMEVKLGTNLGGIPDAKGGAIACATFPAQNQKPNWKQ